MSSPHPVAAPVAQRHRLLRRLAPWLAIFVLGPLLLLLAATLALRMSLPRLSGRVAVAGMEQGEASIERDYQGHVTVRARSRADAARALGADVRAALEPMFQRELEIHPDEEDLLLELWDRLTGRQTV